MNQITHTLDIGHFIEGGTVDNPALMQQWQLCDEAMILAMTIDDMDSFDSVFKEKQAEIVSAKAHERLARRFIRFNQLLDQYNQEQPT